MVDNDEKIPLLLLKKQGFLSERAFNVCIASDLYRIDKLKHYFYLHGSFIKLRNCGNKTNEELLALSINYQPDIEPIFRPIINSALFQISIKDLQQSEGLSEKCIAICSNLNMQSFSAILLYFLKFNTFKSLNGIDAATNNKLISVCWKYLHRYQSKTGINISNLINTKSEIETDPILSELSKLTLAEKKIIDKYILSRLTILPVRLVHMMDKYLEGDFSVTNLLTKTSPYHNSSFHKLKGIGENTIKELKQFRYELFDLINKLIDSKEGYTSLDNIFHDYLIRNFSLREKHYKDIFLLFSTLKLIPVFRTIKILADNKYILPKKSDQIIFNNLYDYNSDKLPVYKNLAIEIRCTIQAIRQKYYASLPLLYTLHFFNFKFFEKYQYYLYNVDSTKDLIIIDQEIVQNINLLEQVNYNKYFVANVFSHILSDSHALIWLPFKSKLFNNKTPDHIYKNMYLVTKEISECYDFDLFLDDITRRFQAKRDEKYQLDLSKYLLRFSKNKNNSILSAIINICQKIMAIEFNLIFDPEDKIVFERNTKKKSIEYIPELLEEIGHPLSVNEIFVLLDKKYPGKIKSPALVRALFSRIPKDKIICFGRSSTYGLKIWEKKYSNIKGGTIREIVEEYLDQKDVPCSLGEIFEYVKRFRPNTHEYSIYSNLVKQEDTKFVFFQNYFIGLKKKVYPASYIVRIKRKVLSQ